MEAEDIPSRLHGPMVFPKFDTKYDFLQIPLVRSLSFSTKVNTPFGSLEYNYLRFDLSCSPFIFQTVFNNVVSDVKGVEVYQDYLIIHDSVTVAHIHKLIALLRRLIEKNIAVNTNNCSFCESNFECLVHLVDGNGFKPDMKRDAPLTNGRPQRNLTELSSLMGALQYCSRFVLDFSCRLNRLHQILT